MVYWRSTPEHRRAHVRAHTHTNAVRWAVCWLHSPPVTPSTSSHVEAVEESSLGLLSQLGESSLPGQGGEMGEKPSAPRPALYYNFPRFVFVRDFILEFVYSS